MKKYTRNVHMPDSDERLYDNFVVVKTLEKFYPNPTGAHADVIRRELMFKNFDDAVAEYLKQCERAWTDVGYAEKHAQEVVILHTVALQGFNSTAVAEGDDIPDTFRTARYSYTCEE